jgi:hypothetical protein
MTGLRFLRAWRIFIAVCLLANVTLLALNAAAGNPFALFNAAGAACCLLPVVLATKTIRRRTEQMRPRPDYAAIARMERDSAEWARRGGRAS